MGQKYKIRKDDLRAFYSMTDQMMSGNYHDIYKRLGWTKGGNGNFHCWNAAAHGRGTDNNPSMSVDNKTGQWHCFSCSAAGNFQSYWKEVLKGDPRYGDSYSDFVIDFLGLNNTDIMRFSSTFDKKEYEENREKMMAFAVALQKAREEKSGHKYLMTSGLNELLKEETTISKEVVDEMVASLLSNPEKMAYLKETRGITPQVIERHRLGLDKKGRFSIPIFDAEGYCLNIKLYDPQNPDTRFKWQYWEKGLPVRPLPIDNFTKQKIYIFEGEPDMLCAVSFGIEGAVTMGGQSNHDVNTVFGPEMAKQIFYNKEIVIVFDTDAVPGKKTGKVPAQELAHSLYQYARQIKIVDLDISPINAKGLDSSKTKIVTGKSGAEKHKRLEKDFTDYIQKNGFNENALFLFNKLVDDTEVYTENEDRTRREIRKVTLQESRMARHYSPDGSIVLELISSVSDFDSTAYQYPTKFCVVCSQMGPSEEPSKCGKCKNCMLQSYDGFDKTESGIVMYFEKDDNNIIDRNHIRVSEHNILGLIQVTDAQKQAHHKRLIKANVRCNDLEIIDQEYEKLLHVRLSKDVAEYGDPATSSINVEAYMLGEQDVYANKSYKFNAVATNSWDRQYRVLFAHHAEPIATSIENFVMNEEIHNILLVFRRRPGENIEEHLKRRYDVFSNAAGMTGRHDLFLINDLTFFSAAEIHNTTLLPSISRGYVESLIAGETRCGKTVVSKFLHNHYKIGEFISGSGAVSRTGLLGGITTFKNSQSISWGKIPANDGGIIIIDELSQINYEAFDSLTPCRSSGVADVQMSKSGKVPARTRKIMLSNQRGTDKTRKAHTQAFLMLKDLCFNKDEILSRFDIAYIVKQSDVDYKEFKSIYDQISTEFTEFQCQNLIKWCYSRKPDDIVLETDLEAYITERSGELLQRFHPSSQLVNIEIRAKVLRMSVSIATMLYSIPPNNDWNKIYVSKEHVDFICKFLVRNYCHPNIALDRYSEARYQAEKLGDMRFMEGIIKYVGYDQLIKEDEFTESTFKQVFFDYIDAVISNRAFIINAKDDAERSCAYKYASDVCSKLINLLCKRNCFERTSGRVFKKTEMFSKWLLDKRDAGYEGSDYLDVTPDELAAQIDKKIKKFESLGERAAKRKRDPGEQLNTLGK